MKREATALPFSRMRLGRNLLVMQAMASGTPISPYAAPVDVAGEDSPGSFGQVVMLNGRELNEAIRQQAFTTMPPQDTMVQHTGDMVTSFGLILAVVAEVAKWF